MSHSSGSSGESKTKILVVEDDQALARQLVRHLEGAGFEVHAEHAGRTALVHAAEHRADLVLLDVMLPDMSGYDVCVELRRIYHPWILPVLMLTGLEGPKNQLKGFGSGADAYLTKPVGAAELVGAVRTMLDRLARTR